MHIVLILIVDELPDLDDELPDITIGQNGSFIINNRITKTKENQATKQIQAKQHSEVITSDDNSSTNTSSTSSYVFKVPQKQVNSKQGSQPRMSTSPEDMTNAQQTILKQQKETRDNLLKQLDELQKKLKEVEERDYHPQL